MTSISLTQFLSNSKRDYLNDIHANPTRGLEWTVVMGNEAGDLDSLASSISYAYFLSTHDQTKSVPLVQIDRADLILRSENIYALERAGITDPGAQLLFLSDIPPGKAPSNRFALVDHNKLDARFWSESAIVTAIIDHHADEKKHLDANPRIVVPAGSCASLVANLLFSPSEPRIEMPSNLATLLVSAILIDTNGLKPKGKALAVDYTAASHLLPRSSLAYSLPTLPTSVSLNGDLSIEQQEQVHTIPALEELTATLGAKKTDLSHLGTYDILRRDYKEYAYHVGEVNIKAGLSTVPLPLQGEWAAEGKLLDSSLAWMKNRNLDILGVLTTFRKEKTKKDEGKGKGKHKRESAWIVRLTSKPSELSLDFLADKLFTGLESSRDPDLKLEAHDKFRIDVGEDKLRVRVYKQKNKDVTRKGVAPLLERILVGSG